MYANSSTGTFIFWLSKRGNCIDDVSCGHNGFCHRTNPKLEYGVCTPYLGLKVNEQVSHSWGNDVWTRENAFRLCESYFADKKGFCRPSFLSTAKGLDCTSDNDCFTSLGDTHNCKCTLSKEGKSMCDAGPADHVWVEAKTAFIDYMQSTTYCHPARGLGVCQ